MTNTRHKEILKEDNVKSDGGGGVKSDGEIWGVYSFYWMVKAGLSEVVGVRAET